MASDELHAALRLLEIMQIAGPRLMGFIELRLVSTARSVCRAMNAVPLESYLDRVFELSLPSDTAELQRILSARVCGRDAWPPNVRGFALAAILRVPGLELDECLHGAACFGYADTVAALVAANAAVDSRDDDGETPLHVATTWCQTACVVALLEANATVNAADRAERATPLQMAMIRGDTALVAALLDANASLASENKCGATALHYAAQHALNSRDDRCVKALLKAHAATDSRDRRGVTSLHLAAQHGRTACVIALLEADVAMNSQDDNGLTALHYAARAGQKGSTACASALLEANAAVDTQDRNRFTPLHVAAHHGHTAIVAALLKAHAAVASRDNRGLTPLDFAYRYRHRAVLDLLRKALIETLHSQISAMPAAAAVAGRIAGKLRELGTHEVLKLIETPQALAGKVDEAIQTLKAEQEADETRQ